MIGISSAPATSELSVMASGRSSKSCSAHELNSAAPKSWRDWDLRDWNSRLLQHFFQKSGPEDILPIVTLLVTKEELAKAVHDSASDPAEVQKVFVTAVLDAIPKETTLLEHAWSEPFHPDYATPAPPFVAHLVVTCLAASESSDELGNEGRYRARLNELTQGGCPDKFLHFLKDLWERLQRWLEHPENRSSYRHLVLPDPGSHTRIGYSEYLAFPSRLDQRDLTEVLRNSGMVGNEPPPGKVISAIGRNLAKFRKPFVQAFEEFRSLYLSSSGEKLQKLSQHRLWSAVLESCRRGRSDDGTEEQVGRFELVASFYDESLGIYLLSRSCDYKVPEGFVLEALPEATGPWVAAIVDSANRSSHKAVDALFSGEMKLTKISLLVAQGFLPFVAAESGQYTLARSSGAVAMATHAFVRYDLVQAVMARLGGKIVGCVSPIAGWKLLEGIRAVTVSDDDTSALRDVWLLQRQLAPRKIYLAGGIRSEDGWLGFAGVLPAVKAEGATSVIGTNGDRRFELSKNSADAWLLPTNDYNGPVNLAAYHSDELIAETSVKFIPSPASEEYKRPANPHAYYSEGQRGAVPLKLAADHSEIDGQADIGLLTGKVILLGRNQGEFVAREEEAAWKVIRGPNRTNFITVPHSPVAGQPATAKASLPSLRRKWRTLLQQSSMLGLGSGAEVALHEARGQLSTGDSLPIYEYDRTHFPDIYAKMMPEAAEQTVVLAHALAGRGAAKRGIPFNDWKALTVAIAKLPEKTRSYEKCAVEALTRCWQEAGLIDVVTSASWSGRTIFPLRPTLALIRNGSIFNATLSGLCLDATSRRAKNEALSLGLAIEEKRSPCRLVPAVLVFTAPQLEPILALASKLGVEVRWTLVTDNVPGADNVEGANPIPSHYDSCFRFRNWSLNGKEHPSIALTFYKRDDRPAFWGIEDSPTPAWSYSKNAARILACRAASVPPFKARGDHEIVVEHAYLPLPFARYAASAGPILPGPDSLLEGGQGHVYAFGTQHFRDQVLAAALS